MERKTNFKQTEIGEIPEEWEIKEIGEYFEVCTGNGMHQSDRTLNGLYPIMGANGIIGYSNEFLVDGEYILTGRVGTLGEVTYKIGKFWISDNSIFIGNGKKGDLKFLHYYLKTFNFQALNVGSTQPLIKQSDIKKIKFPFPVLSEQRAIAKILSDLDGKIELNHQMNKTLESIAQAIFKRWFVDFEFPNEHNKPYKSSGGKMVDSELGEIPEGWNAGMLLDILELQIGGDWGEDDNFEGAVRVVSLRGTDLEQLKSCGYALDAPVRWIKNDSLGKRRIDDCDILIGGSGLGPIGRSIYCSSEINSLYQYPVTYSNFCKRLSSEIPAYAIYAECILENMYRSEEIKQYFTGTSIPNLDTNSLLSHEIVIPPKTVATWFYQIVKNKYARLYNNENIILSQIRDSLLPRLMLGKIRVAH